MSASTGRVTQLLIEWQQGDERAMEALMPLLYDELRAIAEGYLRRERPGHTLQPTALVHEAFLKLVDQREASWQNRAHFIGVAAQAMRRILVDHARRRRAAKRDGGRSITLDEQVAIAPAGVVDVEWVDEALQRLARLDERQARIVELRFFGGLNVEETAEALGISPATVKRDWVLAKAWLQRELSADAG